MQDLVNFWKSILVYLTLTRAKTSGRKITEKKKAKKDSQKKTNKKIIIGKEIAKRVMLFNMDHSNFKSLLFFIK